MIGKRFLILVAFSLLLAVPPAKSQGQPNSNISMTLYQVTRGQDGKQYVVAKNGQPVFVPGLNIAPNATQIQVYRDGNNNFWYVDQNNRPTQVTHQQLQWVESQMGMNPQQNN